MPPLSRIREILEIELAEGLYPIGTLFPTEQELCDRFELGRHTIREAMRGLQELGLLVRQPDWDHGVSALCARTLCQPT